MRNGILDLLYSNPRGFGAGPSQQAPEVAYEDDAGNLYGYGGDVIQRWQPSADSMSLYDVATAPAKMAVGMANAFSPYGQDGWRVPPIVQEPLNALGRLAENSRLPDGSLGVPDPSSPQNQQDVMTGILAMYGGNTLGRGMSMPSRSGIAPNDYMKAAYKGARHYGEPTVLSSIPENMMLSVLRATSRNPELPGTPANAARARIARMDRGDRYGSNDRHPLSADATRYNNALMRQNPEPIELSSIDGGKSSARLSRPFFDNGFRANDSASIAARDAYANYVTWAHKNNITPIQQGAFDRAMSEAGFTSQRIAGQRRYIGVEPTLPTD